MPIPHAQTKHRVLLDTMLDFVAGHSDQTVNPFRIALDAWGNDWVDVDPAHLPASDKLEQMIAQSNALTRPLLEQFVTERAVLHWEQAYSRSDSEVEDHMLANYGYAEVVGKQGPFLSSTVRAGIALYGPDINYPLHQHQAEEIYVVLAGRAQFRLSTNEPATRVAGDVIHHPSMLPHGLHTGGDTLVIFYVWKGGNLREKPSFIST